MQRLQKLRVLSVDRFHHDTHEIKFLVKSIFSSIGYAGTCLVKYRQNLDKYQTNTTQIPTQNIMLLVVLHSVLSWLHHYKASPSFYEGYYPLKPHVHLNCFLLGGNSNKPLCMLPFLHLPGCLSPSACPHLSLCS